MAYINAAEVVEMNIVVHAMGSSGVCYGTPQNVTADLDGQVFIPQGVAARFGILPGDALRVRVVPNNPDMRDRIRWRSIYIYPREGAPAPHPAPAPAPAKIKPWMPSDETVKKRVEEESGDGRVWTMRAMFEHILQREPDYKDTEDSRIAALIGNHLRSLQKAGKLWCAELFNEHEKAYAVYFCADVDELVPDRFK